MTPMALWLVPFLLAELDHLVPVKVPPYTVTSVRTTSWDVMSDRFEVPQPVRRIDAAAEAKAG